MYFSSGEIIVSKYSISPGYLCTSINRVTHPLLEHKRQEPEHIKNHLQGILLHKHQTVKLRKWKKKTTNEKDTLNKDEASLEFLSRVFLSF